MKYLADLLLLLLAVIAVGMVSIPGAVFVLLIAGAFGFQYWKTTLLLGDQKHAMKVSREVMAGVFALGITAVLGVVFHLDTKAIEAKAFEVLWADELFPLSVLFSLICSVAACSVVAEKRKR